MMEFTVKAEELSSLAARDMPPPDDIGAEVHHDDEVLAELEWLWKLQRVGLYLGKRESELELLQQHGWRCITDTEATSLDALTAWLKE